MGPFKTPPISSLYCSPMLTRPKAGSTNHLKLDPRDINKTGLCFLGEDYVDTSVPFGYRHGSVFMQRVTDSFRCIMHKNGYFITNYIDDFFGLTDPRSQSKLSNFYRIELRN